MRQLKPSGGTPLSESGLQLDDSHVRKLRALGVTSVEELFGLIQSDPQSTSQFLEISNLASLQADAAQEAESDLMMAMDEVQKPPFSLGALPPEGVEVEERASEETFQKYLAETPPEVGLGEGAEGTDIIGCFGPIRNQGHRGTCVAHAVAAIMECLRSRESKEGELSEQWLYWRCKEVDGIPDEEGTFINVASKEAVDVGVCLEDLWTYNPEEIPGNEGQGPAPPGADADASQRRMGSWDELASRSTSAITDALDEGLPVAIGVPVYDNWHSNPAVNAFGDIPMPLPLSLLKGGHAMCIAGYDYDPDVPGGAGFIVRNSWGTGWAAQSAIAPGYGVLPFPYVEQYGWGAFVLHV